MVKAFYGSLPLEAEMWMWEEWCGMGHWWALRTSQGVASSGQRNQAQGPTWTLTIPLWAVILSDFTIDQGWDESVLDVGDLQGESICCSLPSK